MIDLLKYSGKRYAGESDSFHRVFLFLAATDC